MVNVYLAVPALFSLSYPSYRDQHRLRCLSDAKLSRGILSSLSLIPLSAACALDGLTLTRISSQAGGDLANSSKSI